MLKKCGPFKKHDDIAHCSCAEERSERDNTRRDCQWKRQSPLIRHYLKETSCNVHQLRLKEMLLTIANEGQMWKMIFFRT